MEQQFSPFTEVEKRFVLAEAIKKSTIPVERLYSVFLETNVAPDWEHMQIPYGRDISQCKMAFESLNSLRVPPPSQLPTAQPQSQPQPQILNPPFPSGSNKRPSMNIMAGPDTKRRKSGAETPNLARDIRPKPSNGSPMSNVLASASPAPVNPKKRGRPSKADVERKQREAIERGDIIPPGPVAALPAGPQGQEEVRSGSGPILIAPAPGPARSPQAPIIPTHTLSPRMGIDQSLPATMSGDSGKKRKPRPPPKPKVPKPGESQFSIHSSIRQPEHGEQSLTAASTETAQAGPLAAPAEAENPPPPTVVPVTSRDPAPALPPPPSEPQPESRTK